MSIITIDNDGPLIVSSNYWDLPAAQAGNLYCSINAGAFRLLLPRSLESVIADMETGKIAVISRGPWPAMRQADAIEILLDDGSEDPVALHLDVHSIDRMPLDSDTDHEWTFAVWTQPRRGVPHKAMERKAYYRRVESLPWLKPWYG